jgi:hypothetical protein
MDRGYISFVKNWSLWKVREWKYLLNIVWGVLGERCPLWVRKKNKKKNNA